MRLVILPKPIIPIAIEEYGDASSIFLIVQYFSLITHAFYFSYHLKPSCCVLRLLILAFPIERRQLLDNLVYSIVWDAIDLQRP